MPGGEGVQGSFEGTLTFSLDGRCRSSTFEFVYGSEGYGSIKLEFDPFSLTKLQKDVSRFIGGYLAKEWLQNGPDKKKQFMKTSSRALVADVFQQENLNDCGVFMLENMLRSLSMDKNFLKKMAEASSESLKSFPWPTQGDITTRKHKLKEIAAKLFSACAEKGISDVEVVLKDNEELKAQVVASLTDSKTKSSNLGQFEGNLHSELAARQIDKEKVEEEYRRKEDAVQQRREDERRRREELRQKEEDERRNGPNKPKPIGERDSSDERSISPAKRKKKLSPVRKKKAAPSDSESDRHRKKKDTDKDRGKEKAREKDKKGKKSKRRRSSSGSDSRSRSRSSSRSRSTRRKR